MTGKIGGRAGEVQQFNKNEGADNPELIFRELSEWRIEAGKVFHDRTEIRQTEFFHAQGRIQDEDFVLGRAKVYFCLMQEMFV